MRDRYSIFDYYLVDSDIHKLNSFCKILSILLLVFCVVMADSVIDMIVINFFLFIMMVWSNISFRFFIENLSLFKVVVLFIGILFGLIYWNVYVGIIWSIKILDVIVYVSIVTMTTSFSDMVYGIERVISPLRYFCDIKIVSLKIGMFVKMISLLYRESDRVNRAKMLRGIQYKDMSLSDKFRCFINNIGIAFRAAYYEVDRFSDVMYLKNYGINGVRTNYRLNKWGKTDTILLVINVVVMIVTFIY